MGKKFLPRIPQDLCALLLAVIIWAASPGFAGDIPPFTPNVVDPGGLLKPGDSEAINAALEVVRTKADIWGAVYMVSALNGESIESLAEQAFRAWKLGAAGRDNGLLLVIAMNDRASRFEVGYGLEGELTDVHARRALDHVLAPHMRAGDVRTAIIQSFYFMAGIRSSDPTFKIEDVAAEDGSGFSLRNLSADSKRGIAGLLVFYLCLWIFPVLVKLAAMRLARSFEASYPDYKIASDATLNHGKRSLRFLFFNNIGLKLFLSVNPGVFIFAGCQAHGLVLVLTVFFAILICFILYRVKTNKYRSARQYQLAVQRELAALASGGGRSGSSGRSSGGSSRSSSSSSSRSSSGGGRSGGGGASSRW